MKNNEKAGRRLLEIYSALNGKYGRLLCPLKSSNPLELMVATILSAQCTDKRVNQITELLFSKYKNVKDFAGASQEEFEAIIRPVGYYRAKASNIIKSCRMLIKDFDGKVPASMEQLILLPGVGRKTANVILGNAFAIPGFPVDTHVKRLMNRIGIVKNEESPEKIESAVTGLLPKDYWTDFSHLLIAHGRNRCRARRPDCANCEIRKLCDYKEKNS